MNKISLSNKSHNDTWVCLCGNEPAQDGFYTCDNNGNEVEPTEKDWTTNNYVCANCGRVINVNTLEVVKQVKNFKLLA